MVKPTTFQFFQEFLHSDTLFSMVDDGDGWLVEMQANEERFVVPLDALLAFADAYRAAEREALGE